MNASELPAAAKRAILAQLEQALGAGEYRRYLDNFGEDELIALALANLPPPRPAPPPARPARRFWRSWMGWLLFFAILGAGLYGMDACQGSVLGVLIGIATGGFAGAVFGPSQTSGGPISMVLGGIGGAIGGGMAGWNKSDAWYPLVLGGAFLGVLVEWLVKWVSENVPRL